MRKEDLSESELLLTDYFGVTDIVSSAGIDMISLYRLMIQEAFMNDDNSCYSTALRLAWKHIQAGGYRKTLEFDNIILRQLRLGKLEKLNQYAR